MPQTIVPAGAGDAEAIAALHAESWRNAYRSLVPDEFLDHRVVEERRAFWRARLATEDETRLLLKATADSLLIGFVCALRDADPEWGPLLDNLHVKPGFKGRGVGRALLSAARAWSAAVAPGRPMHLWVIEDNLDARRFYDRAGGGVAEQRIVDFTDGMVTPALRYVWPPLEVGRTGP